MTSWWGGTGTSETQFTLSVSCCCLVSQSVLRLGQHGSFKDERESIDRYPLEGHNTFSGGLETL